MLHGTYDNNCSVQFYIRTLCSEKYVDLNKNCKIALNMPKEQ